MIELYIKWMILGIRGVKPYCKMKKWKMVALIIPYIIIAILYLAILMLLALPANIYGKLAHKRLEDYEIYYDYLYESEDEIE